MESFKKGDVLVVHGKPCTIFKVWPFGTYDVLSLDGKNAYRVTGLYGAAPSEWVPALPPKK